FEISHQLRSILFGELGDVAEAHAKGSQSLSRAVVQFASDVPTFVFLDLQQPLRKFAELLGLLENFGVAKFQFASAGAHLLFGEFLTLAQGFLSVAEFGDVGVSAKPASDFSGGVANRNGAGEEPAILTIFAAHGKGIFPDFAGFEEAFEFLDDRLNVIGMKNPLPAPTLDLFEGGAGVVEPALVVPEGPTGAVGHPGKLGHVIGESLVVFLGSLDFGDIEATWVQEDNSALMVANGVQVEMNEVLGAIRPLVG